MKTLTVPGTSLEVSTIALGCMGFGGSWKREPVTDGAIEAGIQAVKTAVECGINTFDHADIYARGKSEEVFSHALVAIPELRDRIVLQTKCGIRVGGDPNPDDPVRYDFSYDHIMRSVEGSLERLKTDYIDILLLHRPDVLVEPEEVGRSFDELHAGGRVRYFGVSNHTPQQIELLHTGVSQPLIVNQVQLSPVHTHLLDAGVVTNQDRPDRPVRGDGILEYCRLHGILVQAWTPVARGALTGRPLGEVDGRIRDAAALVAAFAERKGTTREAIVLAWLLRIPGLIQPVIGTKTPDRIRASCQTDSVELTREEWYRLYAAGRGAELP